MARIDRSLTNAHAGLTASRGAHRGFAPRTANVQTVGDLIRRLPFLFVIAAPIAAVIVIAASN